MADQKPTREKVRAMHADGFTVRQIATELGLAVQGIYRHVRAIEAEDEAA
ncbi:MAG: helix-turn-helix domain-containing protein [Intrasporangiaceae bacterium]|nr:helix-turn-helix domain-containing protein [Intrasporangiaceae bacterium]